MGLTRMGTLNETSYKWKISVYDLKTDTEHVDKYFSINHFNTVQGTHYTPDSVQKLKKLRAKLGDYTMDDVRKANRGSVLAKYGHLKFEKINEPLYQVTKKCIFIRTPLVQM